MDVEDSPEVVIARIASAIGEPARVRMLYCLLDGHARTATELGVVGEVSPSTASAHLNRLRKERLVRMFLQGKHRYYSLEGESVAAALEGLTVIAGGSREKFVPNTPNQLREARTCYDHIAGRVGVLLHNRLKKLGWLDETPRVKDYKVTPKGLMGFDSLGIDVAVEQSLRRRFAYACIDWSERQPHLGGALGASLLKVALKKRWVVRELDSRALEITRTGKRELLSKFGIQL
jgi:DNA-binding transcriptional ArsR family regulator